MTGLDVSATAVIDNLGILVGVVSRSRGKGSFSRVTPLISPLDLHKPVPGEALQNILPSLQSSEYHHGPLL
jgi:hypothetical protein